MRHGDGGLALFNGSKEENGTLIDLVLTQAGRGGRGPSSLTEGGFHRMQAGRSVLIVDCGPPPPPGVDRFAHAGTLSMELSVGRDRLIVNCGAFPAGPPRMARRRRATAAHSTLVIADTNSSECGPRGWAGGPRWWRCSGRKRPARTGWTRRTTAGASRSTRSTAADSTWPRAAKTSAART